MIIITVIFILAMSLSAMAISTRMQFNKTDNRNKATDLAEMGITYYQSIVNKYVASANAEANLQPTNFDLIFYNTLNNMLNSQKAFTNTVENPNSYEIDFNNLSLSSGKYIVNFVSKGMTGQETVNLTGTITIQKSVANPTRTGQTTPSASSFGFTETNPINLQARVKVATYNSSTYFTNPVQIQGKRFLTVKGDAYFSQDLIFQGAAVITINGDAIFQKPIDFPSGTPYTFCVYGNTYLVNSSNHTLENYPILQNSCSKPPSMNWTIDMANGTSVQY